MKSFVERWTVLLGGALLLPDTALAGLQDTTPDRPDAARAAQAGAIELPVRRVVLDNGMTILALPRPGAPTISLVVRFSVGGVNERPGTTGAAHFLEHMMFRGSQSVGTLDWEAERRFHPLMDAAHDSLVAARAAGDAVTAERLGQRLRELEDSVGAYSDPGAFDRVLRRAGARGLNATTTSDATTYFVDLPSRRLEEWFRLEADRMANPVFRGFHAERRVVMEERRLRVEGDPAGALAEAHLAAAFAVHPYRLPVVGYMSDLQKLGRAEVADYHAAYYGANNAVVAIAGHLDPDEVERLARRYFGPLPAGDPPPPVLLAEPEQRGERRVELVLNAQPLLRIGWKVPQADHPDTPALELLTSLLTGGRSSRLYRRLVLEDRSAVSVYTSFQPGSAFPRLLVIGATPRTPATAAEVEEAIYEEIDRLGRDGPSAAELGKVANQTRAGAVRGLQSNFGLALRLAEYQALFGEWREMLRRPERLRAVTSEATRRVVREYLVPERRTVAVLVSDGGER